MRTAAAVRGRWIGTALFLATVLAAPAAGQSPFPADPDLQVMLDTPDPG